MNTVETTPLTSKSEREKLVAILMMVSPRQFAATLARVPEENLTQASDWIEQYLDPVYRRACDAAVRHIPFAKPARGASIGDKDFAAHEYLKALVRFRDRFGRRVARRLPHPWVAAYQWTTVANA